jgi:ferredoxin, 2Fe-2S
MAARLSAVGDKKNYKVTFKPLNKTVDVDGKPASFDGVGEPRSILDVAIGLAKIDIEHTCGGVAACSTCHVIIEEGLESCNEPSDQELDMLDNAPDNTLKSRLSCQCIPSGEKNIVVRIPEWNRNLVRETPH